MIGFPQGARAETRILVTRALGKEVVATEIPGEYIPKTNIQAGSLPTAEIKSLGGGSRAAVWVSTSKKVILRETRKLLESLGWSGSPLYIENLVRIVPESKTQFCWHRRRCGENLANLFVDFRPAISMGNGRKKLHEISSTHSTAHKTGSSDPLSKSGRPPYKHGFHHPLTHIHLPFALRYICRSITVRCR